MTTNDVRKSGETPDTGRRSIRAINPDALRNLLTVHLRGLTAEEDVAIVKRIEEAFPYAERSDSSAAAPDSNDSGGEAKESSTLADKCKGFGAGDLPPIGVGKEGSGEGGVQWRMNSEKDNGCRTDLAGPEQSSALADLSGLVSCSTTTPSLSGSGDLDCCQRGRQSTPPPSDTGRSTRSGDQPRDRPHCSTPNPKPTKTNTL